MGTIEKLKELGYSTVDDAYYKHISDWENWYKGDVKGFHNYNVRNGHSTVRCRRFSLGVGKKIAEDWANLLMNEKVKITLEGKAEQEFIDSVLTENNFAVKSNEMQERVFALGTGAFVPHITGATISSNGYIVRGDGAKIALDYVSAEHIFPISWRNGTITECAFDSTINDNGEKYLYLQIHTITDAGTYDIANRLYKVKNGIVGSEVALTDVKQMASVPAVVHTGSDKPQFVIDRPNIANNLDAECPLGISVFANAIDVMRGVDIAYDSYVNEFALGKKRIMVKPTATTFLDGEPVFDHDDVVFYVLPEDIDSAPIIMPIDMTIRTEQHSTGIQDQLNLLSSKCGFGEQHYKFDRGSVATATQIVSENSNLFRTIKKHEIVLEEALKELCRILLRLGNMATGARLNEDVEISIDFDDSIIEDKQADFNRDLQLLSAGILNDWEFRAKWLNEDEATAKAALPRMQDMTTEEQEEIE